MDAIVRGIEVYLVDAIVLVFTIGLAVFLIKGILNDKD